MTDQHPITPPPELVRQWTSLANEYDGNDVWNYFANWAAQWGADRELEACCEWFADDVVSEVVSVVAELRAARRPKPPSLKEQALAELEEIMDELHDSTGSAFAAEAIRRAL